MAFTQKDIKRFCREGFRGSDPDIRYEKDHSTSGNFIQGFGLRTSPRGKTPWTLDYRPYSLDPATGEYRTVRRARRVKLGNYPTMTLALARQKALRTVTKIEQGIDPLEKSIPVGTTLKDWAVSYLQDKRSDDDFSAKSMREAERRIYKHLVYDPKLSPHYCQSKKCPAYRGIIDNRRHKAGELCYRCEKKTALVPKPPFTNRRLLDITEANTFDLHRSIGEGEGKPRYEANRVFTLLSVMLEDAKTAGKLDKNHINPCNPKTKYKEQKRERILSVEESQALIDAIARTEHHRFESLFWLLTYTGLRVNEARTLRWSDIELDRTLNGRPAPRLTVKHIRGSKDRTIKNKEDHYVPLSRGAVLVLEQILKEENNDYVFASTQRTNKPYARQPFRTVWDRVRKEAGLWDLEVLNEEGEVEEEEKRIRWHDIRRTFITTGNELQHPLHTLGSLVGQKTLSVTASYAQVESETARLATDDISEKILSDLGEPEISTRVQTRTTNNKNQS